MTDIKFEDKTRQPTIPLSLENVDLARAREFILDYTTQQAWIKNEKGELLNIFSSPDIFEYIKEYILKHPDMILSVIIRCTDGEKEFENTVELTLHDIYNKLYALITKEYNYAGSKTNGGPAVIAKKVNHSLNINTEDGTIFYNGENDESMDIKGEGLFKKTGGYVNGPMTALKTFLLAKNISYGLNAKFPENPEEGEVFIRLIQET